MNFKKVVALVDTILHSFALIFGKKNLYFIIFIYLFCSQTFIVLFAISRITFTLSISNYNIYK